MLEKHAYFRKGVSLIRTCMVYLHDVYLCETFNAFTQVKNACRLTHFASFPLTLVRAAYETRKDEIHTDKL